MFNSFRVHVLKVTVGIMQFAAVYCLMELSTKYTFVSFCSSEIITLLFLSRSDTLVINMFAKLTNSDRSWMMNIYDNIHNIPLFFFFPLTLHMRGKY